MKRKLMLLLACLFVGIGLVTAQTQKITGVVISEEDGQPVVGASVLVKGTTQGTITDVDGNFNLSNVPSSAKTLQISYIGMQTQEVVIKPNLKVVLKSDSQKLDEVVVTAMGIKRSEKSLGYSVTSVKGDEITKARESNVLNSLSGKIAGVQIGQSSGTAGGSSSIQIRGASSIGSVSSPLFIVDGLPIDNGAFNPDRTNGIVDVGNRAGDISSDDIESINVLKGAAATALYGARAKDGAIVITTKKGSRNSQVSVTVNSSTRFENVLKLPDFQNDYAQGSYGKYNVKMLNGWGPKISSVQDQTFADFKGEQVTLQAYPDNVKDFYETGMSYINNVAIAGGTERSDFRISVSTTNQTGVVPGSDYNKYAFAVNGGMNFTKNFTGRVSAQYIRSDSEGRPAQGSNDNNLLIPLINGMPRTVNINDVKNNWIDEYGKQISLDPEGKSNNPYWIINKNKFTNQLDRLIGNIVLTYKPIEGLTISNNAGTDFYTETRRKVYSKGTIGNLEGQFQTWDLYKRILNNDLMISYEKTFAEDYGVKVMLGHNIYQEDWRNNNVLAQNLVVDELYAYTNAKTTSPVNYTSKKRLVGLYGDISFSYKNMVFLDVTGRNDWSSTLPVNNRSYFYPSISGSFIFTELMKNKDVLSYGKLRMSYANVGSDEQPYQLAFQYTPVNSYFLQYNLTNVFPHNGLVGFTGPRVLPNENLKPQNQASFEVGTDLRFFQNRIRLDLTYYKSVTKNQIVSIDVPLSTGYFANNINAGKVSNKGIEVALGVTPVQTKDFKWDLEATFAKNTQKVDELAEGLDEYSLTSGLSGLQIKAEVLQQKIS
jgi:TonB-linked SusC/RagA family outer membrane protein